MSWIIAPLDGSFERAQFDCGDGALNRFIRQYARQQQGKHLGQTRVAVAEGSKKISGFYTLSAGSIGFQSLDEQLRRQLPKYPIPAARLGRLAVDKCAQGQGLGHKLLAHAFTAVAEISGKIGIAAVVVDAKDEKAAAFYRCFGFMSCQDQPLALYLMTETLCGVLGKLSGNKEKQLVLP